MTIFRRIQVGELIFESAQDNFVAHAGGGQANAAQIGPTEMTRIITVANVGDSLMLPPAQPGLGLIIVNHGANAVQVFGQPGDTIDDNPSAIGVPQMANSWVFYGCFNTGWYTEGLASGFTTGIAGQFATFATSVVVAGTTHTQAGGTPITTMNVAVTVNNPGDGVTLPVAKPGMEITIVNLSGANALQVYGSATDSATINGTAGATGVSQATNTVTIYFCFQSGIWVTK